MDLDMRCKRKRGVKAEAKGWGLSKDGAAFTRMWSPYGKQVWGISGEIRSTVLDISLR